MKIIVQKFGGTSVATDEKRIMILNKVVNAIENGYSPIVVVSAIGRIGDPYATDTLLSLIDGKDRAVNKREADALMCCGEIISAAVISEVFAKNGHKVMLFTGGNAGIITDDNFGDANIKRVETKKIMEAVESGIIPIVTGFQGITEEGDLTTLGRGGSDITAAAIGQAVNAESIEIYTDVDGIMTADPRIVPDAKIINKISYSEVFEFAAQGAKVIHPLAVKYAMKANIPLIIKNTESDAPGTIITNINENSNYMVSGITSTENKAQVTLKAESSRNENWNDIFELLENKNIQADLVNLLNDKIVFTVDSKYAEQVERLLKEVSSDYKVIDNCSKIAVIGNDTESISDIMKKTLKSLSSKNIKIFQTAGSSSTIWCLISQESSVAAINELHKVFF